VNAFESLAVVSAVLSGLVGGVFFAFSVFVMRALAQLAPPSGVSAMQRINVTVINALFLGPFLGSAPLLGVTAYVASSAGQARSSLWLWAAFVVYTLGSVVVTLTLNVPRNNRLAALQPESQAAAKYWPIYLREWLLWNHVRCAASLAASAATAIALSVASARPPVAA
jgi:uncharacterized membrane protein